MKFSFEFAAGISFEAEVILIFAFVERVSLMFSIGIKNMLKD